VRINLYNIINYIVGRMLVKFTIMIKLPLILFSVKQIKKNFFLNLKHKTRSVFYFEGRVHCFSIQVVISVFF